MDPSVMHEDAQQAMERNMQITRDRIMTTLDRMLDKMRIVCCMDKLTEEKGKAIADLFKPEDLRIIMRARHRYAVPHFDPRISVYSLKTAYRKKDAMPEGKIDPKLTPVLQLLFKNDKVRNFARCEAPKSLGKSREFLESMVFLRNIIHNKLHTTSTEQIQYEKRLGKLWKQNEFYKKQIVDRESTIKSLDNELNTKLAEKNEIVAEYTKRIKMMSDNNERDKVKIINVSERTMAANNANSLERTEELAEEARFITQQYETLVEQHMKNEKALRTKRFKIETQLVSWLGKYDQDITELQKELEIVSDAYLQEKEKMDDLESKFDKLEEQYIILMEEKAIEEQRIFDMKVVYLIRYHSCKKIQKWWRAVLAWRNKIRKPAKGKGKGGKGKGKRR